VFLILSYFIVKKGEGITVVWLNVGIVLSLSILVLNLIISLFLFGLGLEPSATKPSDRTLTAI